VTHSIRTHTESSAFVVELAGDIDSAAADRLEAALAAAVAGPDPRDVVVVDLAGANFLDSRSIGILSDWQARLRASGGRLALAGTRPEVARRFGMIGLEEAFDFFETRDAARDG
jgi:anti-anti-sigma factor